MQKKNLTIYLFLVAIIFLCGWFFLYFDRTRADLTKLSSAEPNPNHTHILVSIKPIHSLVAAVMEGVAEPVLLIKGAQSPHTHALNPEEAKILSSATLVFWVGEVYEAHMARSLKKLATKAHIVKLSDLKGLTLYNNRFCEEKHSSHKNNHSHDHGHHDHDHGHHDHDHGHHHDSSSVDGHLWLAPANAKVIVIAITEELISIDPANSARYKANSKIVIRRLDQLEKKLTDRLSKIQKKPYIIYHDFMQYFDNAFKTQAIAAITSDPDHAPNAHNLVSLRKLLKKDPKNPGKQASCVFTEPQAANKVVQNLAKEAGVSYHTLDYLGVNVKEGPHAYFDIMRDLARDLLKGLE
jgi:zinc transport system substrate-binding protein